MPIAFSQSGKNGRCVPDHREHRRIEQRQSHRESPLRGGLLWGFVIWPAIKLIAIRSISW